MLINNLCMAIDMNTKVKEIHPVNDAEAADEKTTVDPTGN